MKTTLEVERKYAVPGTGEAPLLPALAALVGTGSLARLEDRGTRTLEATYLDSPDLRLLTAGVTLRRRTGGDDAGWHLKLPAPGDARTELSAPAGASTNGTPPRPLSRLVVGLLRGAPLQPVAHLTTHRSVVVGLDESGAVLVEVVADDVRAEALAGEPRAADWRELEVELKAGGTELLDEVEQALRTVGAEPAEHPSKLARILAPPAAAPAEPLSPHSSAGEVVLAHLREQVGELRAWDPEVRRDTDDAVHKARVATRRLRSALRTYRSLFDRERTDPVRAELKWLATELGAARDLEVMRDRLLAAVAAHPPELVIGPVAARIQSELGGGYRAAHRHAVRAMSGRRYFALLDALDDLVTDPPLTAEAAEPADRALPRLVRKAWRRVDRLAEVAAASGRDEDLHEVRKAAKRARYAGESVTGVFGEPAAAFAAAMEEVQEVLGDHQDGVVTRDALRDLGVRAHLSGENAFTFGMLAGLEEARGDAARDAFAGVWAAASAKRLRRWLRS